MQVLQDSARRLRGIEEFAAPPELPGTSVKLVGTRFGDEIDSSTQAPSKLGGVIVGQHFHFQDVIGNRCDDLTAGNCFIIVHAIQEVYVAAVILALN